MPKSHDDATREGVRDAFGDWLASHDVTVPDAIEHAVHTAVTDWLNANRDQLAEAVAETYRRAS